MPTDPYSLKQAYQRWDYQDYAYLWTLQSEAVKQTYRTRASRYHMTGFSLWMREHLRDLPDIAGRWHLDEKAGLVAYDSSKNNNHGTITGPSPVEGWIDGGYFFDGLNDRVKFITTPSLDLRTAQTFECLFSAWDTGNAQYLFNKGTSASEWIAIIITGDERLRLISGKGGALAYTETPAGTITYKSVYHLASTLDPPDGHIFLDGEEVSTVFGVHPTPDPTSLPTYIGCRETLIQWLKGVLDHAIYYNRVLDLTEIKRHSARRYPP
ncbi:hypothetical protein ES703_113385 [subsurface metagenome]